MMLNSIFAALAASKIAAAYYLQVEAPDSVVDGQYLRGVTLNEMEGTSQKFTAFDIVPDKSDAWDKFHIIDGYLFGPFNNAIGYNYYLMADMAARYFSIDEDGYLDSPGLEFYACQANNNPEKLGNNYAWYASSSTLSVPSGSETGGSETGGSETGGSETGGSETGGSETGGSETGGSETGGSETGGETSPTDTDPSVTVTEPNGDVTSLTDIDTPTDTIEQPIDTDTSVEPVPGNTAEDPVSPDPQILTPDPEVPVPTDDLVTPDITGVPADPNAPAVTNAPAVSSAQIEIIERRVKRQTAEPPLYPVDFDKCIAIRLKSVTTGSGSISCPAINGSGTETASECVSEPITPSCTGTQCCRTYCTMSCVKSGTGCAAPSCKTYCPSDLEKPPILSPPETPVPQTPTVTPEPPCNTCIPRVCTKCQEPAWVIPGCPTCVRTVTNYVFTCPSLTTITIQTCPTINKCGTLIITAAPGKVTVSGLAIIAAKEDFTTVIPSSKATASGTTRSGSGSTSAAKGSGSTTAGGSGATKTLGSLLVLLISFVSMLW